MRVCRRTEPPPPDGLLCGANSIMTLHHRLRQCELKCYCEA
jgi:hypothetical protein